MRMSPRCALSLAAVTLLAGGCGGGEVDPPDIPATVPANETIAITAKEYVFSPNRISVAPTRGKATQQERTRIELANRGELAHNIEVLDGERIVGRLRSFPAGQERPLTVTLPPGRYRFICTVADHDEKGMRGTLEVQGSGR